MKVTLHGTLRLACRILGSPMPQFTWMKDWRPLANSHRTRIREDEDGNTSIHIEKVMLIDAGVYSVSAENAAGKVQVNVKIDVEGERVVFLF